MGLSNVLVLSQLTTYILGLCLALCIIIPVSFHLSDFKCNCLLFSNGTWRETDGQFQVTWASPAFCGYSIAWAGLSLFISLIQVYRFTSQLCRGSESSFLSAFCDIITSILMSVAALAGAVIITFGYQTWCNAIMLRFEACEDATLNDIDKEDGINTSMFYMQFGTAQFGAWTLWVCWVGHTMFAMMKVFKYHQQENIRSSMARERARVVGGNRHSPLVEE